LQQQNQAKSLNTSIRLKYQQIHEIPASHENCGGCLKFRRKIAAENSAGKFRRQILAENCCGKFRRKIQAENLGRKFLRKIAAENSC
jgi:hypothetical protein